MTKATTNIVIFFTALRDPLPTLDFLPLQEGGSKRGSSLRSLYHVMK